MKKLGFLACGFGLLMAFSCAKSDNVYDTFHVVKSSANKNMSLNLETVHLETVHCSGESFSGITPDGTIYYLDRYFGWLYEFSQDGKLLGRKLGFGRGPEETLIKKSVCFVNSESGEYAMCGKSLDFELFSKDYKKENNFRISYGEGTTEPDSFRTYSNAWSNMVGRLHDGLLYQGKMSENPSFNYFDNTESYLKESMHMSVANMRSGEIEGMKVTGFPSVYGKDPYKFSSFQCINFDVNKDGNMYVNFEADSLIYVFDKDMKPQFAFGAGGKNMDRDYSSVSSWEQMPVYQTNRETKGYYSWVECIDETGMCFRSYRKGDGSEVDGLQIYDRKGKLLGDVDVPRDFKVTGYAAPYYYSQVFDGEDDGSLCIYRFTLD